MKFGGTSVADAAAFENVARIVANERDAAPVVVVSAMSGVTDSLLAATTIGSLENVFARASRSRESRVVYQ
jgi:aspartate kinase